MNLSTMLVACVREPLQAFAGHARAAKWLGGAAVLLCAASLSAQSRFDTPQAGADALAQAAKTGNQAAMRVILGPPGRPVGEFGRPRWPTPPTAMPSARPMSKPTAWSNLTPCMPGCGWAHRAGPCRYRW